MPYQGRQPGVGVRNRFIFIATSGQTSFSGADSNGLTLKYPDATYTDVFLNGALLIPVTDYAATNNTSVVLSSGAVTSDVVEIVAYDISSIANTVPVSGGTFSGPVTVDGKFVVNGNNYPSAGALSNRNLIINGAVTVAQRGTSATGVTGSGYYTCDRFSVLLDSLGAYTLTQAADGPVGFASSLKMETTTADASPANADAALLQYTFEGQNLQLLGKGTADANPMTLSFWVKSNVTGTYTISVRDRNNSRDVGANYVVSVSGTWEYVTVTFPADTTGPFNNSNTASMEIEWWLGSGTNYTSGTVPTAWEPSVSADRNAGSNVNLAATIGNYFQITGVQLEVGDTATPFEHRSYGQELTLCQRYYEQSNPTLSGSDGKPTFVASTGSNFLQGPTFKVPKRAVPSMVGYDSISEMDGTSTALTIGSFQHIGVNGALRLSLGGTGRIDGQVYRYHWTADAEL